jgi:hypothetical protein
VKNYAGQYELQASIDISGIKIQSFFLKSASSKVNKLSNNICD